MPTRYYISLPDPARARGADAGLAFRAQGADAFAAELQDALRDDGLFQRWRAQQAEPDEVDAALGATDPGAAVFPAAPAPRAARGQRLAVARRDLCLSPSG